MRIVALSDTHGKHNQVIVPDGDVLVHAGDFMNSGRHSEELRSFKVWFCDQPHKHKIVIAGNHDLLFEDCNREVGWARLFPAIYLLDSGVTLNGVRFWGSPYTPEFNNWAFNEPRGAALKRHWDMIPSDTDVLITHGPQYLVLDTAFRGGEHLGCKDLSDAIQRVCPKVHIFGHIHGGYGTCYGPGSTVTQEFSSKPWSVNASVVNEAYQVVNAPWVIDL